MKKCMYCKDSLGINYEYFSVSQAVKKKGLPRRWKVIGDCCDLCESDGKKIVYEYGELAPNNEDQ